MSDDILTFFSSFQPFGALLDPSELGSFTNELEETVDRVLILRLALGLVPTTLRDVHAFVNAVIRFSADDNFRDQLLAAQADFINNAISRPFMLDASNRAIIEGDWDLKFDLDRILEWVGGFWVKQTTFVPELRTPSASEVRVFAELLRGKLRDLEAGDLLLLHYKAADLARDKYLVYFLDIGDPIGVAIRANSTTRDSQIEALITEVRADTSLLSRLWAANPPCDVDLRSFVPDYAKRQLLDLALLRSVEPYETGQPTFGELITAYSKAKRAFEGYRNTISTPDEGEMSEIERRWSLRSEYSGGVFAQRLADATVVPHSRRVIIEALRKRIESELHEQHLEPKGSSNSLHVAASFAIQRGTKLVLSDLAGEYASIVWPEWIYNMASFPSMALDIVLRNVMPAVISSALGAYLGWRLKRKKSSVAGDHPEVRLPEGLAAECISVIDFILEEMIRYQFYLFDQGDVLGARESVKALGANLSYLMQKTSELEDPILLSDLKAMAQLFDAEAVALNADESRAKTLETVLSKRRQFSQDLDVLNIIQNKTEEIVQQHLKVGRRNYDRTGRLTALFDRAAGKTKKGGLSQVTAKRLIALNAPYILCLSLRQFLSYRFRQVA